MSFAPLAFKLFYAARQNAVLVSKVYHMYSMFVNAHSFNQPLNKWDVSNVTKMYCMFKNATSFNQPLHAPWYAVEQSDSE